MAIDSRICRLCGQITLSVDACKVHHAREHTFKNNKVIGDYELYEFTNMEDYFLFLENFPGVDEWYPDWSGPGWYYVKLGGRRYKYELIVTVELSKKYELMDKLLKERDKLTYQINDLATF